jgi:hypothetical protein
MSLSIVVPYAPISLAFLLYDIRGTAWLRYDYHRIHHNTEPYPWDSVLFIPSWATPWVLTNLCYIAILTTIPIFVFFGMTRGALDAYRRWAVAMGCARCFPALSRPFHPGGLRAKASPDSAASGARLRSLPAPNRWPPLPNTHHQAIVSSSGIPCVPPRRSSTGAPMIPPRKSSLNNLRHVTRVRYASVVLRMPSITSLRSRESKVSGRSSSEKGDEERISMPMSGEPLEEGRKGEEKVGSGGRHGATLGSGSSMADGFPCHLKE